MFSSFQRPCFSCGSYVDPRYQEPASKTVAVLRQSRVSFTPKALMEQRLTPLDLFPFCFHQYLPWAFFFNHDIEFHRLVDALHAVAQKYHLLCGRLCTDELERYVIEVGSKEGTNYEFPVSEMEAEMRMAEAILSHGQTTTNSADFPVHPDKLPFYLESLDLEAIHKGQDPFLRVKLTHFSDGCCLAISICHFLVDGMRFSELYSDIGRAYCGKKVPMRDINREYVTLERFSQQFTPEDKRDCAIPNTTPTGREPFTLKQYPNESSFVEILHLSKELINDMKSRVAPFIPKGSFVSTADLIQALLWMLECELRVESEEITNSKDLGIAGTSSTYIADLYCNGHGIIPNNYLGNGIIAPYVEVGQDLKSKSFLELLASLALRTRQKQVELKQQPKEVFKLLVGTRLPFTSFPENSLLAVSNFCKFAISDTSFGEGPPSFFLSYPALPMIPTGWVVSPVLHDGGFLLTKTMITKHKDRLKKSSVLKECAPGVRFLFDDFCTTELNSLMKQK